MFAELLIMVINRRIWQDVYTTELRCSKSSFLGLKKNFKTTILCLRCINHLNCFTNNEFDKLTFLKFHIFFGLIPPPPPKKFQGLGQSCKKVPYLRYSPSNKSLDSFLRCIFNWNSLYDRRVSQLNVEKYITVAARIPWSQLGTLYA